MQGKIEIIMSSDGRVEVHSNFADKEQVRYVLELARKAMLPGQSFAEINLGKNEEPAARQVRRNPKDYIRNIGFPRRM
jgi:hypothetical protein